MKGSPSSRPNSGWLFPLIGYAISIFCLIKVYQDYDWASGWPRIQKTPLGYVIAAVLCEVAAYCVQGWRWQELLRPVGVISMWRSMQAIYVGLFANETLPLRPGEVIRVFLQARWSGLPFTVVASSAVVERLFDGIWLILAFLLTSAFLPLPPILIYGSRILGGLLLVMGGLLALAVLRRDLVERLEWTRALLDGLQAMGRSKSFYHAMLLSLLYLVLQIGPFYFLQRGFGLHLGLAGSAALLVVVRVGTIPPQGPGNVGSFQYFVILGAGLFGVRLHDAISFATLLFFVITVPLWTVGFFALLATKMKLSQLRHHAAATEP